MGQNNNVIIIGGGLSGLTLAWLLAKRNIGSTILEASPRLGGRIQTVKGALETPLELGATWFSDIHTHLLSLVYELGLTKYPQYSKGISLFQTKSFEPAQKFYIPEAEHPSYRIAGGTQALIDTLTRQLPDTHIHLNTTIRTITATRDNVLMETTDGRKYNGDRVVICLPPQLAAAKITFTPELPDSVRHILPTVQTWMAGAVKFTLEYDRPFWRNEGYSGMLYSHAGIITEMYDHTNFEETKFGFTGFLNGGASSYSQEVRKELVLQQLSDLMGDKIPPPIAYYDKIWSDGFVVEGNPVILRPHQNNGHPALHLSYMNDRLHFCGTETAGEFPGYMEGAIIAAKSVAKKLQ